MADHERRGEQHRPEQAVTELRAGLRIRGDALGRRRPAPVINPGPSFFSSRGTWPRLVLVFLCYDSDTPSSRAHA